MQYIKKDSSGKVFYGPIVKSTDGYSALTGIGTGTATGSVIFMYGTSSTGNMTTAHSWEEIASGYYLIGLASNAIGTLGHLRVGFVNSSAIPTYEDIRIIAANPFDSLVSTSDYLQVDAVQIDEGAATAANINIGAVAGSTVVGTTDFRSTFSTAAYVDIGSVAGSTVNSTKPWHQTSAAGFIADVNYIRGETVTTDAADNWDNFWFNNDAVSTERISDLPTTGDLLTTASSMSMGAIAGSTIATGTAQLGVNVVKLSSQAISSQAGANLENYYNDGGVVSTEAVGDLPTTADLFTTANIVEANVVAISSQSLTTQTGANLENFFQDGGAVSTEVLGDLPTTADLFTTASEVDVGRIRGEQITTDAADNWDNYWFNNDVVSTERVSDLPTTADLFTTASEVDVGRMRGEQITTDAADNWDNFWFNNDVVSTERVSDLPTTADLADLSTFNPASNLVDVLTWDESMQMVQAYAIGDFGVTGVSTNVVVYDDHAGTTFFQHTFTTKTRTRAT
jgi:hypothetical protein